MKKMIPALLVLMATTCCLAQHSNKNIQTARLILDAFNEHDWEKMVSYYADNAVFEDPSFPQPVNDKTFIAKHHAEMQAYFPDIRDDIKALYPSGDHVIIEFVSTGTSVKGEKFSLPICTVLTFRDGKVIRDATYYDNPQ
jgi:steroid delta-isomerase-like uncharacterized protein